MFEIELTRMVVAVARDAQSGINAQLASLPRDGADTTPASVTIRSAVDDVLPLRDGDALPAVIVQCGEVVTRLGQLFSGVRDADVDVWFLILTADPQSAAARREAAYVAEAIVRSMQRGLLASAVRTTAGVRNGVHVMVGQSFTYSPITRPTDSGPSSAAVQMRCSVRRVNP